jgi:hypothetical protein
MNAHRRRKAENSETNAARQARLRERRKELGFKRVTVWLSPEQVDRMERQGGELWLGTTVKQLLESAVVEPPRPPQPDNAPMKSGQPEDKATLFQGVEQLRQQGASWRGIAKQWNEQGRRTATGAVYRGMNLARDYRKWKERTGE